MTEKTEDLIAESHQAEVMVLAMSQGKDAALGVSVVKTIQRLADALEAATRERDAALAAIERVRAILDRDDFGDDWEHDEWVYREAAERKLGEIETALDGAPEPEWEYGLLNPQAPSGGKLQDGAHLVSDSREHIIAQQRRGHPAVQAVRRRKAGPWLSVEGESKP